MNQRGSAADLELNARVQQVFAFEDNRVRNPMSEDPSAVIEANDPDRRRLTDTTIVIPTCNESANIGTLVERLSEAFEGRAAEILFVDDSSDDTPQRIAQVAAGSRLPVRLIHREGADRTGGLAGAVKAGVVASDSEFVLVMDGDLQHPPEIAPLLRDAAQEADLAVASRYVGVGDASNLGDLYRRLVSSVSTVMAQACFPWRVGRHCTDPMSGFFCFRRSSVDMAILQPRGYKILFEILARHDLSLRELPFTFGERLSGSSKASWRNGLAYLSQLFSLRMGRLSRFAVVGALGTVVNLSVMALLLYAQMFHYVAAALIAAEVSILLNFCVQERFVFRDLRSGSTSRRLGQHLLFNNAETILRLPLLVLLVGLSQVPPVLAQAITIGAAFLVRFLFMSRVVYRTPRAPSALDVVAERAAASVLAASAVVVGAVRAVAAGYATRAILPPLAMVLAFPHAVSVLAQIDSLVGVALLLVVAVAAVAMVGMRAKPTADEPDVHDRQLDLIAGVPLLVASVWLSMGGAPRMWVDQLTARDVMAMTAFLAGASFVLLGTRMVLRLRWALWLPMLALPVITERSVVAIPLIVGWVVVAALPLLRRPSQGRHAARAGGRLRTARPLPRLLPASASVLAFACALCVSNLGKATTLVSLP